MGHAKERYDYFTDRENKRNVTRDRIEAAIQLGKKRLNPTLGDPNFLVYRERAKIISNWLEKLEGSPLCILDVGGRIRPYDELVQTRTALNVAIDPQFEGLVDIVGIGEALPFSEDVFDLVICTQVLSYAAHPARMISEIHRVLKPNGLVIISAPAFCPRYHDERWRFLPDGLRLLLSRFSRVEMVPEGHSISGLCRILNMWLDICFGNNGFLAKLLQKLVSP